MSTANFAYSLRRKNLTTSSSPRFPQGKIAQSASRRCQYSEEMKLTVAIPSYGRPAELGRALDALAKQQRRADEVIVIARQDDGATQSMASVFSNALPIVLSLVEGTGVIESYNRAFDSATGDVISFIDDDAVPHADWAARIVETFQDEFDLAGLGGKDRIFANDKWLEGEASAVGIVTWYGRTFGNHHLGFGQKRNVDCLKGVNMSFRRELLGGIRMDPRLRGEGAQWHCELKLCLEMRALGRRLAYDPTILVDHFPAPRHDADQRGAFSAIAYENQIHNLTLALLDYLPLPGRVLLLTYALTIGFANNYCGILKGLLYCMRIGPARAWCKTIASFRGIFAAWRTWRSGNSNRLLLGKSPN